MPDVLTYPCVISTNQTFNSLDADNGVLFSPGNSPGIEDLETFYQGADGTLLIEIGGLTPGNTNDSYDQINISGQATLDRTLQISLWNGFMPSEGDSFQILTYGSVSGYFDNFSETEIGNELVFVPRLEAKGYFLDVVKLDDITQDIDQTRKIGQTSVRAFGSEQTNSIDFSILNGHIAIGDYLNLSGYFTINKIDDTKSVIAGKNVEAFLSRGSAKLEDGSINPEALGVVIKGGTLGLVLFSDNTCALTISGQSGLVGLDGLDLTGTLTARVNTSGRTVDETIAIPESSSSLKLVFNSKDQVKEFKGDVGLGVALSGANIFTLSGSASFTYEPGHNVKVDVFKASIPGFVIRENGFTLGKAELRYGSVSQDDPNALQRTDSNSGKIKLGNIFEFDDIRIGVFDFTVNFDTDSLPTDPLQLDGSIYIAAGGALFFPSSSFYASIIDLVTSEPGDKTDSLNTEAVRLELTFTDGIVDDFIFE